MILYILIAIPVLIVAFLVIAALQPPEFRVERSVSISAAPATVFGLVNDFHQWQAWSPWAKMDPAAKNTYEGAATGAKFIYTWQGNSKVGQGRMTIVESRPNEVIRIKLEFFKPFASTGAAEFTFKPQDDQTVVTWSMTSRKVFVMKAFGLVMSMDKMMGGTFDQGLADMKKAAEANK